MAIYVLYEVVARDGLLHIVAPEVCNIEKITENIKCVERIVERSRWEGILEPTTKKSGNNGQKEKCYHKTYKTEKIKAVEKFLEGYGLERLAGV